MGRKYRIKWKRKKNRKVRHSWVRPGTTPDYLPDPASWEHMNRLTREVRDGGQVPLLPRENGEAAF